MAPKKEEVLRVEGTVVEALPNACFKVRIEGGHVLEAYVSGKMRMHWIRIVPGDKVQVEISPYDLNRGRIVYRGGIQKTETETTQEDDG